MRFARVGAGTEGCTCSTKAVRKIVPIGVSLRISLRYIRLGCGAGLMANDEMPIRSVNPSGALTRQQYWRPWSPHPVGS